MTEGKRQEEWEMAREMVASIGAFPMLAIGLGEMTEERFLRVARRLHMILRARDAKLSLLVAEEGARRAIQAMERAKLRARELQRNAEEGHRA